MTITGTPNWPVFSTISLRFSRLLWTSYSVKETPFSVKYSFAAWQKWQVGVVYISTVCIKKALNAFNVSIVAHESILRQIQGKTNKTERESSGRALTLRSSLQRSHWCT